jgi:hypothetical protein
MASRYVNDKNEVQQGQGFYTGIEKGEKGKSCPGCGQPLPGERNPYPPGGPDRPPKRHKPFERDPYPPDVPGPGDPDGDNPYGPGDPYKPSPRKPDPWDPPYGPPDGPYKPDRHRRDPRKRPPPMIYMEEGTEGQTYPDERREEAQQATLANYYEKKSKHRGPQSGRVGNFGAGTQHPGHTGDSGLFDAYYQNVLGMNPDKKEQS